MKTSFRLPFTNNDLMNSFQQKYTSCKTVVLWERNEFTGFSQSCLPVLNYQ